MDNLLDKCYELIDDRNPHFNRYNVILNGVSAYQECFSKDYDPNIFIEWEKWNSDKRSNYIEKCIDQGEPAEETCKRLRIRSRVYTYYKYRKWELGIALNDWIKEDIDRRTKNFKGANK